ncbi:MAG: CDP-alcohol phosphatidyltransferase family protein [Chloroflexota bacterium]
MKNKIRYVVPNSITFMSLACGLGSILLSSQGHLITAGILVLVSYTLDIWDGFTARKLNAQTSFGLQLDSLVDMVSLGIAPAVLVFHHLMARGLSIYWILPFVMLTALAGAFRLARFNLLPPKTSNPKDSVGLPITQSGGTMALAVLSDLSVKGLVLSTGLYIPLLLILSVFMVSTISFPPSSWFFLTKVRISLFVIYLIVFLLILPFFTTWFILYLGYLAISTSRAFVMKLNQNQLSA